MKFRKGNQGGSRAVRRPLARVCVLALVFAAFGALYAQAAYAQLRVTPTTWNVVGLDSNNPNVGPDLFPVGVRVCNTGVAPVNNVVGTFVWDSASPYLNLSESDTVRTRLLAPLSCVDLYYPVTVTRSPLAYNKSRRYHIAVTGDNVPGVSTPTPRELYVEKLVSQGRNSVQSISGPTSVYVGFTYTYTVVADTATQGYEQLEAFLNFSNIVFQVQSVATTYSAPLGATNDKFYADACGWNNDPTSASYRSCAGPTNYTGGKVGGLVTTVYTVKVLSTGTTNITSMIYDFSGSSYHYNSDFGRGMTVTALPYQPNVVLTKSVSPAGNVLPGADLTYTILFENTGNAPASQLVISDPVPDSTDFKLGSAAFSPGTTGLAAPTVEYSNDALNNPPLSWAYVPTGAPGTYDPNVRHVRWKFTGTVPPGTSGSVTFTVRVR